MLFCEEEPCALFGMLPALQLLLLCCFVFIFWYHILGLEIRNLRARECPAVTVYSSLSCWLLQLSPGGGFGPVSDQGYGVSYMVAGDNRIFFHVSSKKSVQKTDSRKFVQTLFQSLDDMKNIFADPVQNGCWMGCCCPMKLKVSCTRQHLSLRPVQGSHTLIVALFPVMRHTNVQLQLRHLIVMLIGILIIIQALIVYILLACNLPTDLSLQKGSMQKGTCRKLHCGLDDCHVPWSTWMETYHLHTKAVHSVRATYWQH